MKALIACASIIIPLTLVRAEPVAEDIVRAKRIEIVNEEGQTVLLLKALETPEESKGGGFLEVSSNSGERVAVIASTSDGALMKMMSSNGPFLSLTANSSGSGLAAFHDHTEPLVRLVAKSNGMSFLNLRYPDGEIAAHLQTNDDSAIFGLRDQNGSARVGMYAPRNDGAGRVMILDDNGQVVAQLMDPEKFIELYLDLLQNLADRRDQTVSGSRREIFRMKIGESQNIDEEFTIRNLALLADELEDYDPNLIGEVVYNGDKQSNWPLRFTIACYSQDGTLLNVYTLAFVHRLEPGTIQPFSKTLYDLDSNTVSRCDIKRD